MTELIALTFFIMFSMISKGGARYYGERRSKKQKQSTAFIGGYRLMIKVPCRHCELQTMLPFWKGPGSETPTPMNGFHTTLRQLSRSSVSLCQEVSGKRFALSVSALPLCQGLDDRCLMKAGIPRQK
jgi:hypothetical protein